MNSRVNMFVTEVASLTQPEDVVWIDGSPEQREHLRSVAIETGELIPLLDGRCGSYLHRTHPQDVARVEDRTFICTKQREEAGTLNNWCDPCEMKARLHRLLEGSMKGKQMYVIPYAMGHIGSPFAKYGVEITDSIYVVLNMLIMTRVGREALDAIEESGQFVRGVHASLSCDPEERYIAHFPEEGLIYSVNTAYGGNVLMGKKCFALRIGSYMGRQEGWLAEHMLILGIDTPEGETYYVAAAFPSACGKTNLAMLVPPKPFLEAGYRVYTLGDDIAWLRVGEDGRLWAINPEYGFFGVAPGTSARTNPNALATTQGETIFTNTALDTTTNAPWWEGLTESPPKEMVDWLGNLVQREEYQDLRREGYGAAHPNARFTAPLINCPSLSPEWDSPTGVPISAILFGGRRRKAAPLVYEARDWRHGVFLGTSMASETTAAATGEIGVTRRDPMAMRPFLGYDMGDYFSHWLTIGERLSHPPKIYHVNWFRRGDNGEYLWAGFGENFRVLHWVLQRLSGRVDCVKTPIGNLPYVMDIDTEGLDQKSRDNLPHLLSVDTQASLEETEELKSFYHTLGDRVPKTLYEELEGLRGRLLRWQN